MPDADEIVRAIAGALDRAAAGGRRGRRAVSPVEWVSRDHCLHWSCRVPVRVDRVFCRSHLLGLLDGTVDECPGCARAKESWNELCAECTTDPAVRGSTSRLRAWYRVEYEGGADQGNHQ